eukprot:g6630.t1
MISATTLLSTEAPSYSNPPVFNEDGFELIEDPDGLPSAINFRDLAESDPYRIKPRQVYRSSEMFKFEVLSAYGIKTLIDMRKHDGDKETNPVYCLLESKNCVSFLETYQLKVLHFNLIRTGVGIGILSKMPRKIWWELFKGKVSGMKSCDIMCSAVADPKCFGFSQLYKLLIDKASNVLADLLRVFANADNYPILMHCTHGKDRTGIVAYLLEAICGVSLEDITNDYTLSETNLKQAKSMYKLPISESLLRDSVILADSGNITELVEHIELHYGGLMGYLSYIGLSVDEVCSIRENLMKN